MKAIREVAFIREGIHELMKLLERKIKENWETKFRVENEIRKIVENV